MALRFLTALFEPLEQHRRQVTNAATSLARRPASGAFHITRQLRRLLSLVRAQDREIEHLRAVVNVMAEQLVELGVDPKVFEYRVEAELDRVERDKQPATKQETPPSDTPYR